MDGISNLLVRIGLLVRWLLDEAAALAGAAWSVLDRVLNPVLSPVLRVVNPVCTAVADVVYAALSPLPIWAGLTLISLVGGVILLLVFRATSNQKAIGAAKDAMKANLLALKLYKDEIRVTFVAQWRLLKAIGRLQYHMLRPLLIMLFPMLLVLAQMGVRYQWRPLESGEQTVIKVQLADTVTDEQAADSVLTIPDGGADVEVGPVPGGGEAAFRIKALTPGTHVMRLDIAGTAIEKELVIGTQLERVSPERVSGQWTAQILQPVESVLPADGPVRAIIIDYPARDSWFHGADWWILTFFILSMIAALIFAPIFKVRF